jgi:hypothetical protein
MIHVTIPVTAKGEPIPLVKLGQGRGDEHESGPLETVQTFAEKLRKAGYQEPVIPNPHAMGKAQYHNKEYLECDFCGFQLGSASCLASHAPKSDGVVAPIVKTMHEAHEKPFVSREGFRAGVLSAIAGGVIIASIFLAWGLVAACLFTAACVGFIVGMLITQEWK